MNAFSKLLAESKTEALAVALPHVLLAADKANLAEFALWLRLELHGWGSPNPAMTESMVVPEYRGVAGTWHDDYGRPLILNDPTLTFVNEVRLRHPIGELEAMSEAKGVLSVPMPELAEVIQDALNVTVTNIRFNPQQLGTVTNRVRTLLVERLMANEDAFSDERARAAADAARGQDIIELKPNFYGIGLDLRALIRRWRERS